MGFKKLTIIGLISATAMLSFAGCGRALSKPKKGDSVAPTLNTATLTTEQKLLETGKCVAVETTKPSRWDFETHLNVNGIDVDSFYRQDEIHFDGRNYSDLKGILTFRGDNYRSGSYLPQWKWLTTISIMMSQSLMKPR